MARRTLNVNALPWRLFTLEYGQLLAKRGDLQAEAVSANEELTAIGDHRENERESGVIFRPLEKCDAKSAARRETKAEGNPLSRAAMP